MTDADQKAMEERFVGKEVDYCFHLHTPEKERCRFNIQRMVRDEDRAMILYGAERAIQIDTFLRVTSWVLENGEWVFEGYVFSQKQAGAEEEPRIGGEIWRKYFAFSRGVIHAPW